jgi:hypothetical protein
MIPSTSAQQFVGELPGLGEFGAVQAILPYAKERGCLEIFGTCLAAKFKRSSIGLPHLRCSPALQGQQSGTEGDLKIEFSA